jgi:hypothetical protein
MGARSRLFSEIVSFKSNSADQFWHPRFILATKEVTSQGHQFYSREYDNTSK